MTWIDVSVPLTEERPAWPGDEPFRYEETQTLAAGGAANCARMSLSVHFGTHVDAPYHFLDGGPTIDEIDPGLFIGPCRVVHLPEVQRRIEPEHLEGKVPEGTVRLLARTRNSAFVRDRVFHEDYVSFSEASARWLVERGVRLIGIDYFSIGPCGEDAPTHQALFRAGGAAIENLDLGAVEPGLYDLCCLPLKIQGSGGAPARVVLRKLD